MDGGFSFCGVDIALFNVEYVPPLTATYVFGNGGYQVNEQTYEGHHGGYFYGATVPPKTFTLRCMFEDKELISGHLAHIESFFKPGRTGRLVFKNRDWLYYVATVTSVSTPELTNRRNGFITIQMKAYYPFSRTDMNFVEDDGMDNSYIIQNTGILEEEYTPVRKFSWQIGYHTKNFLLYNGGSMPAHVAVKVDGKGSTGISILNNTNGNLMKLIAFTKEETTDAGKFILCDSLSHKTILTDGTDANSEPKYYCHDHDFLTLEPAFPIKRQVYVETKYGQKTIEGFNVFNPTMVGHYIWIEEGWHKIESIIDDSTATLFEPATRTDYIMTNIVRMNEITVTSSVESDVKNIEFIYKPTFL